MTMTKVSRAAFLLMVASLLVSLFALTATATATEEEPPPESETTVVTTDIEPVVVITTPAADVATADWTYRYLVPTGLALVVLVIVMTTVRYFTNVVRKRYRIVEE
jgi:hypothetical protein